MAFATKLTGLTLDVENTWVEDSLTWWDERELMKDPRFREVHEDAGYVDYVAALAPSEVLELHNRYCGQAHDHQSTQMMRLGQRLARKNPPLCWVMVQIYEWESGL